MGSQNSKAGYSRPRQIRPRQIPSLASSSSLASEFPQLSNAQESRSYAPPLHSYAPPPQAAPDRRLEGKYSRMADNYNSLEQVTEALANAGLESSNLIVGIDFTRSNEWTGAGSFNRKSLHHIGDTLNPYEQAISIIGKTLTAFDEDNLIPCFGFGDESTHDQDVFSFYPDERFCNGFEETLSRYREIVPHLRLAGPTSFAPIVEMAMTIVEQSGGQYHVLVIIADGQVLSPQEQKTVDAIVEASKFPLSIILVGVGDGPWDMMKEFDDNIPARPFNNFQFVNFTEIMSKNVTASRKEAEFSLAALMDIPSQYKATIELSILGSQNQDGKSPQRFPLPPPVYGVSSFTSSRPSHSTSFKPRVPSISPAPSSTHDNQICVCPICLTDPKDMAFGCGHQTCCKCGQDLERCPICRSPISTRLILSQDTSFMVKPSLPSLESSSVKSALPALSSTYENEVCPICLTNPKDMAFDCGHQTCCECGRVIQSCPICRSQISARIKLY